MNGEFIVRPASAADARACAEIYAPYVLGTAATFESEPPTTSAMARRIAAAQVAHDWLVAVGREGVAGYAYGVSFKEREAYRWACEVSVYVGTGLRRSGVGRALYVDLLERLTARGYRMAVAGMTLPNDASRGLHLAMGFEPAGVYRRIGWKLGAWHDVEWMQRPLGRTGESAHDHVSAQPAEPG